MLKVGQVLLATLLLSLVSTQMTLDLGNAQYELISGYWSLNVPVKGSVPPLTYSYQTLPPSWSQVANALLIPTTAAQLGGTWAVKLSVTDALGNKLRRSLLIKISGGSVYLGDYPYEQTFTYTASGTVTAAPSSSTVLSEASSSTVASTTSGAISLGTVNTFGHTTSTTGVIPLQSSSPGINRPLPNAGQLDTLINSGDIVSITQTVQSVISSTLSCTQKTGYLNDFLGRIESFIFIKSRQSDQLQNIIQSSQVQIASLNSQIAGFQASITALGVPGLQTRLASLLIRLQQAYDSFNVANVDLTPFNLNITANLKTVDTLSKNLKDSRGQLVADEGSLDDTNALIVTLTNQLKAAEANRVLFLGRIAGHKDRISKTTAQIDLVNAENVALNNQIAAIVSNKDLLQVNAQALETQAQNLKNTISSYQAQEAQLTGQIAVLRQQANQLSGNLDRAPLTAVRQTISSLQTTVPSLKQQIDYVRFNCNGVVNYTVNTLEGAITYTFSPSAFSTYVTNEFGKQGSNAAQAFLGPVSRVTLTPVTIFTPLWVELFGQSFTNDLRAINSQTLTSDLRAVSTNVQPSSTQFISDFSCTSTGTLVSESGVVSLIVANQVAVTRKNGSRVTVTLGACTNIMMLNVKEPAVGNNVYWRGLQVTDDIHQAYTVLFF